MSIITCCSKHVKHQLVQAGEKQDLEGDSLNARVKEHQDEMRN